MGCARLVVDDDHRDDQHDRDDGSDGGEAQPLVRATYVSASSEYKRDDGSDDGNLSDDTDMEEGVCVCVSLLHGRQCVGVF